jgi:hypothetical protein
MTTEGGTMTPTEFDTRWIELWDVAYRASRLADWYATYRRATDAEKAESRAKADAAMRAVIEFANGYTGWSRFWLVVSSVGHIHSTTACTTCFVTTEFALLPELSGSTEAEAVAGYGAVLCTVCFPSAPVEWTGGELRSKVEARDERARAKAEREAKRLEKALLPNGEALEFETERGWWERITTLAAAKSWLTSFYEWGGDHPSYPLFARDMVADAVAMKTGESVEAVLAAAKKRAEKRR